MGKRKIIDGAVIHEGSGNVYRDLGYPDADEMLVKAQLVAKISEIIRSQELTQVEAARILGVTQPKLSGLRGQFQCIIGVLRGDRTANRTANEKADSRRLRQFG